MRTLEAMKKLTLRQEIPQMLKECGLNQYLIEVGVRWGFGLRNLLQADPMLVIGVDHWNATRNPAQNDTNLTQPQLNDMYSRLFHESLFDSRIRLLRGKSGDVCKWFPRLWADFIYIDADHTHNGCLADMAYWWDVVARGGILAGHDYNLATNKNGKVDFGVQTAVRQFMEDRKISSDCLVTIENNGDSGSWLIYKINGE